MCSKTHCLNTAFCTNQPEKHDFLLNWAFLRVTTNLHTLLNVTITIFLSISYNLCSYLSFKLQKLDKMVKIRGFWSFNATLSVTRVLKSDKTQCLSWGGGWFNFKSMNIDLAEVLHHDCKPINDQLKEKMLISFLEISNFY